MASHLVHMENIELYTCGMMMELENMSLGQVEDGGIGTLVIKNKY